MSSITIDGISEGLAQRLQTRASAKGHTIEEAALDIISGALPGSDKAVPDYPGSAKELLERIRAGYREIGWRDDVEVVELSSRCCCQCHAQAQNRQQ